MLGLGIAAVAAVGAAAAGYQSFAPQGQWFGRAFCHAPSASKQIALTFDDGPNDPHTLNLLDVLSKHNVHATFFVIGRYVRQRPNIVAEVAKQGHTIGNHTFTHPLLTVQPASRIREEIVQCGNAIHDAIGEHSNLFRPPWGGRRPGVFGIVRQLGLDPVMWNITSHDWRAPSLEFIEQNVTPKVGGGDIILLHDGGHASFGADRSATVAAVESLLTRHQAEGYSFVTIPEMMPARKPSSL
jgi:peptidoglycan-N-acetylglucosamine deacetylase